MGEAGELSREWRGDVQSSISKLVDITTRTANSVNGLEQITKAHSERIAKLEASPANMRGFVTGYGGCLAYIVSAMIAGVTVLVSLSALAVALLHH